MLTVERRLPPELAKLRFEIGVVFPPFGQDKPARTHVNIGVGVERGSRMVDRMISHFSARPGCLFPSQ